MITHGYRGQLGDQIVFIWDGLRGKKGDEGGDKGAPHVERRFHPKKVVLVGGFWLSLDSIQLFWMVLEKNLRMKEGKDVFELVEQRSTCKLAC